MRRLIDRSAHSCICVIGWAIVAAAVALSGGCQNVGPTAKFDRTTANVETGTPNLIDFQDSDKRGTINGTGPGGYIIQEGSRTESLYNNTNPRNALFAILPDGTRQLNIAGGSDLTMEGLDLNPTTGAVKIKKLSTSSSAPIDAQAKALAYLVPYWETLAAEQRSVAVAELETIAKTNEVLAPIIVPLIKALTGVP